MDNVPAARSHTHRTQSTRNSVLRRSPPANGQQSQSDVRQDNPQPPPASPGTPQPVPLPKAGSAAFLGAKPGHTQKRHTPRKSAVKITSWVKPVIKQEIERIARQEGLSTSALTASLLEKALQYNLSLRYIAVIDPLIDKAIGKHMRAYSTRLAVLLVRSLFASEQTRSLATNILGRQPGVTQPVLETILNGSSNAAKRNITRVTPQLQTLLEAVEQWIAAGEGMHT